MSQQHTQQQHDQLAGAPPPSVPPVVVPPGVATLVAQAEMHCGSVAEALQHYEAALEQLNAHIQQQQAPQQREAAIAAFGPLLHSAEQLKQQHAADPAGAEYCWRRRQAQKLAEQAVAADQAGVRERALALYFQLLETLNRCHALEPNEPARAAIMSRFQVYLERAEQLRVPAGGAAGAAGAGAVAAPSQ